MYSVEVKNACSCFLKSGMAERLEFASEEQAKNEAEKMLQKMQDSFCKKHNFVLNEQFGDYSLFIQPRG